MFSLHGMRIQKKTQETQDSRTKVMLLVRPTLKKTAT